ncbi:hypothetical protein GCM10027284_33620 [Cyclobacterium sediminis]
MVSILNYFTNLTKKLNPKLKIKSQVEYWIHITGNKKNWTVVQIGANDGKTKDPLHKSILKNGKCFS